MTTATRQPNARRTNGGRLESYEVKCSANLGRIDWPTGFAGGGWALLADDLETVVSRHAFRVEALAALIELDGLECTTDDLAGDLSIEPPIRCLGGGNPHTLCDCPRCLNARA